MNLISSVMLKIESHQGRAVSVSLAAAPQPWLIKGCSLKVCVTNKWGGLVSRKQRFHKTKDVNAKEES